jgi:hypothetical protein
MVPERANDGYFQVTKKAKHHVTHFTFSIGSPNNRWTIEDEAYIVEIDLSLAKNFIALVVVPSKLADMREQTVPILVRHADSPGIAILDVYTDV